MGALKIGCPPGFVNIIRSFHDGMRAAVVENGEMSADFDVTDGTKPGCVLAVGTALVHNQQV